MPPRNGPVLFARNRFAGSAPALSPTTLVGTRQTFSNQTPAEIFTLYQKSCQPASVFVSPWQDNQIYYSSIFYELSRAASRFVSQCQLIATFSVARFRRIKPDQPKPLVRNRYRVTVNHVDFSS